MQDSRATRSLPLVWLAWTLALLLCTPLSCVGGAFDQRIAGVADIKINSDGSIYGRPPDNRRTIVEVYELERFKLGFAVKLESVAVGSSTEGARREGEGPSSCKESASSTCTEAPRRSQQTHRTGGSASMTPKRVRVCAQVTPGSRNPCTLNCPVLQGPLCVYSGPLRDGQSSVELELPDLSFAPGRVREANVSLVVELQSTTSAMSFNRADDSGARVDVSGTRLRADIATFVVVAHHFSQTKRLDITETKRFTIPPRRTVVVSLPLPKVNLSFSGSARDDRRGSGVAYFSATSKDAPFEVYLYDRTPIDAPSAEDRYLAQRDATLGNQAGIYSISPPLALDHYPMTDKPEAKQGVATGPLSRISNVWIALFNSHPTKSISVDASASLDRPSSNSNSGGGGETAADGEEVSGWELLFKILGFLIEVLAA